MSSTTLVTGASGTVGKEVVKLLKAQNRDFAVLSSGATGSPPGIRTLHGNFSKPDQLERAFRGFDTIFLLVPLVPNLVELGKNAIDAARKAGVRHIVRSSGAGADPASPYAIAKAHGEIDRHLQESGIDWTILRPNSFMQNWLTYHVEQVRAGIFYAPHGDGAVSLIDTRDIAACVASVVNDPGAHRNQIYTLTGPEALTDSAQVAAISVATGIAVRYVDIPETNAIVAMATDGVPPEVIDLLMSLNAVIKAGYASSLSDDVRRLSGREPRTFSEFAREHAADWRK